MATVAGLFDSSREADEALSQIAGRFEDAEMRVFDEIGNVGDAPTEPEVGGAIPHLASGRLSAALDPNEGRWFADLDDEAATEFFLNGVRHGGVLAIVLVDDDDAAAVEAILDEHGARTSAEE